VTAGYTHVKCESCDSKTEWIHSKTDLKLIRHDVGSEIASVSTITNIKSEPRECNNTWNHNINIQHKGSDVQGAWIDSTLALKVEVNKKMAFPKISPDLQHNLTSTNMKSSASNEGHNSMFELCEMSKWSHAQVQQERHTFSRPMAGGTDCPQTGSTADGQSEAGDVECTQTSSTGEDQSEDGVVTKRHNHTYTGETPHQCTVCHNAFLSLSKLKQHKGVHTGEKSYQCTVCHKTFTQAGNLKRHSYTQTHTGDKPHECTV
jgi:uncharacterized protein YgiM (DUF1202 family)